MVALILQLWTNPEQFDYWAVDSSCWIKKDFIDNDGFYLVCSD